MNKLLIACDLDGTLLNDKKKFGLFTKLYFRKLERQGHVIIFSSGRSPRTAMEHRNAIKLHGPMVLFNGNLIINPDDETFPKDRVLWDYKRLKKIFKKLYGEKRIDACMCENDTTFFTFHPENFRFSVEVGDKRERKNGRMDEILDADVYNFVLFSKNNSKENRIYVKNYVEKNYPDIVFDFWGDENQFYASILHKGRNKKTAVDYVRKVFNISEDDTYVFGDSSNDVQQVTGFKNGYAMINAFPVLKNVAKNITKKDNNHNGVAHEIRHIIKTKYSH